MPSDLPSVPGVTGLRLDRRTSDEHVYAGIALLDDAPVRVHLYRSLYPTAGQLAARRHAVEMGQVLAGLPGVLGQREVVPVEFDLALVTDAPALDELDRWLTASPAPTLRDRLRVAASMAEALAQVHARGVTHNALHLANIGVDVALSVRIGGLDRAMSLRSEASGATQLAESLTYVSPEQTGRMNRPVDSRSDLYSLGAIFFHLFAGRPPFVEPDALALVHAHVARPAPHLSEVAPEVSMALDAVVGALLEKDPDRRYQTADGVAHDLRLVEATAEGDAPVRLRTVDVSDQLVLREHLYGREAEVRHLADALARASTGQRAAVWVAGYSGIGKSSLVHELEPLVVARFGWFAEGKFDLYQRDVPYVGWVGALQSAVHQLLALPEDELVAVRDAVVTNLGAGLSALVGLCPELVKVIGDQPPPDEVTPHEAQARLAKAVSTFVATLASAQRPLVLFLDDLQWADLASLRLLEAVLADRANASMLVIGAWRENEITPDHPVRWLLRKLADGGSLVETLELAPLELVDVQAIVADAVLDAAGTSSDLGELVHEKTGGNPFFVRQFLSAMQRDGALRFDQSTRSWNWDLVAVGARAITDNVAELLALRFDALSSVTLESLQAAAVVGTRFHLTDVVGLTGNDFIVAARSLDEALNEQLITPLDEQYRYVLQTEFVDEATASTVDPEYAFLHDRVRQAALDTIDLGRRQSLHLAQARALERRVDHDDAVIEVASHLCEALDLLVDVAERTGAAATMVRAARRAKSTMAVATATRYLDAGMTLLDDDAWAGQYALALALHTESADVAYIDGRYDDVTKVTDGVLAHVNDPLDRVAVHNILIGVGVARADYQRATQYALEVLHTDFGVDIPRHPSMARVALELAECRAAIGRRDTNDLLELAPMTDPQFIAVMGILMKTATNAYWAEPNLVPVIAARMIRTTLSHGNDSLSAYGYALYAMVTGGVLGAEATGYRFGQLSMDLLERWPNRSLTGRTALLWHGFVRHSRDPMRECVADLFDTYHSALEAGDVENACYCATVGFYAAVLSGSALSAVVERYRGYVETVMLGGQSQTRGALAAWLQAVELLRSPATRSAALVGEHVDWIARRAELVSGGDGTALPTEGSAAGFFAFVMDDMAEAEQNLRLVWEHRDGGPGQVYLGPCIALYAVTILRRRAHGDRRRSDRVRVARLRRLVRVRARHNPHDMEAFRLFLDAELHRGNGRRAQAISTYLDTATEARRRGVTYLEALALDEAGTLEAAAGHGEQAAQLVATASDLWRRLDVRYRATARVERDTASSDATLDDSPMESLDVRTLIDMMQAISREIEVDGLVQRVLSLVIRNAGATRGVLLLVNGDVVHAVAEGESDTLGSVTVRTVESEEGAPYAHAVVDYVVRTQSAMLIEDAATHELIRRDRRASIDVRGSILCAPLVQAGSLVGVIYLANPQAAGVFTRRQMVVVETICGQAAVSLNNAHLYEEQRSQAESFSRFVPRPFLEQLGRARIGDIGLGDAVRVDATVAFSDVRGFTELSEGSSAVESFELLNRYLGRMEPAIRRHGGFIDKYFGDGVMSLFINGSDGAIAAAVDMYRALETFNAERTGAATLRMGLGVHAGEVMLGTVGSIDRIDTTVIGDTVNTASRLEGATKEFCGAVLASRQVLDRLSDPGRYLLREVGRISVVGKTEVVEVHEVLAARPRAHAESVAVTRTRFAEALALWYAADFPSAARLFRDCAALAPFDELALQYALRCEHYAAEPPVGEWRGVEAMHAK